MHRWTSAMVCVLLTPANEGLFIAAGLGAPECTAKLRRLIGFVGICLLCAVECWTLLRNEILHYQKGSESIGYMLADAIPLGGIWYHMLLIRMYLKRWSKTRSL